MRIRIVPLLSCCDARWLSPTEGTTLVGRIVVGVDGSPASELALRWALNQGALTGAAVEAVNAWQVPQVPGGRVSMMGVDFSAISKEILRDAVAAVGASPGSVTERTVQGHPAQVLVDASDGAELLVVGNRGHGGFTGMLLGSVSGQVLAHARCPTVIVRT